MIITASHVAKHLQGVTDSMIGKCHKAFNGKVGYWLVENSQGELDQDGEVIEYKVTYDEKGFHCTCKSGKSGFANVTNASGVCQHVRSSMAAEAEMKQAVVDMEAASETTRPAAREHYLEIAGHVATDEEYNRIMNATPAPTTGKSSYNAKPFSILK